MQRYASIEAFLSSTQPPEQALTEIQQRIQEMLQFSGSQSASGTLLTGVNADSLKQHGVRRLGSDHFFGANSVAIPITSRKQILKVSLANTVTRRDDVPMVLKPLKEWEENGLKFSVYPEVRTLNQENPGDVKMLHFVDMLCHATGHVLWDLKPDNVGVLSNGVPVIIDSGAICTPEQMFTLDKNTGLMAHRKERIGGEMRAIKDVHHMYRGIAEWNIIGRREYHDLFKKLQEFAPEHSDHPRRGDLVQELKFIENYGPGWLGSPGQILTMLYDELATPLDLSEEMLAYQRLHGPNPDRPIPEKFRDMPLRDIMKSADYHRETPHKSHGQEFFPEMSSGVRGLEHSAQSHSIYLAKVYDKAMDDHNKTLGLKKDEIAGALSDAVLERMQTQGARQWTEGKPQSRLVAMVKEHGLDADMLGDLSLRTAEATSKDSKEKDWMRRMEETLKPAKDGTPGGSSIA